MLASLEKAIAPNNKTELTKSVLTILIIEFVASTYELSDTNKITGSPI